VQDIAGFLLSSLVGIVPTAQVATNTLLARLAGCAFMVVGVFLIAKTERLPCSSHISGYITGNIRTRF
jgi:FtsH-binding integral membrane protein